MEIIVYMSDKQLSQKKLEEYQKWCEVASWIRKYPVQACEDFFGVRLMDYQKYAFMKTWFSQYAIWVECRGAGKDTKMAAYNMVRLLAIPDYKIWTLSNSEGQSVESMGKLRDIALKRISSFNSVTDIFAREIDKTKAKGDGGFVKTPNFHFTLFNNSGMEALPKNVDTIRGKRGGIWMNETAWMERDYVSVAENIANIDSSFSLGVGETQWNKAQNFPWQIIYTSSAGDVTFPFYNKYEQFYKRMLIGDTRYFVYDINAYDILYRTTLDGEPIKSHITEEQIKKGFREDPEKAERELLNKFRKGGGANAMVTPEEIVRNSTYRVPLMKNETGKDKFIFCLDPARAFDGSVLTIYKLIKDEDTGYRGQLENTVMFVDPDSKNKTPLPFNQQVEIFKDLMVAYNGNAPDWGNLEIYIDSGAGGGGYQFADLLMADWYDKTGRLRHGVIDKDSDKFETSRKKYVNASPIVHMLNPKGLRDTMFDTLSRFVKLNLINFTNYDDRDTIVEFDEKHQEKVILLNDEQKLALKRTEIAKTQLSYMCRFDNQKGGVTFALAKEKQNTMHDDAAYTLAMFAYALSLKRKDDLNTIKNKQKFDVTKGFMMRKPVLRKY